MRCKRQRVPAGCGTRVYGEAEKLRERARCLVEGVLAWLVPVLCVVGIMVEGTMAEVAAELIWDSKKGR
jgi:hypothetical protein